MPLLKRLTVMAAKVESTIGTAEALTSTEADNYRAYDVMCQAEIDMEERQDQGNFNQLAGVSGARGGTFTFKTDIDWDGTTTMPSWATVLLAGCGVVESSQVFTPRSEAPGSNVKTLTLGAYVNGKKRFLAGAVGNAKFTFPAGKMVTIEWEFKGVWQTEVDAAILSHTPDTSAPVKFNSATLTYDSVDLVVSEVTLDIGNEIVMREDASTAAGYISAIITSRYPVITANPEATLVATDDMYGDWTSNTEASFAITLDTPTDSSLVITAPKAQIFNAQQGDRDGLVIDDIEWRCNKNGATADAEFNLTFSESS